MAETIGLPEPPEVGASALPADTYAGTSVFITGGGTGLGKAIASEFARLGADIVVASRKPEHLEAAQEAISALGRASRPWRATSGIPNRSPRRSTPPKPRSGFPAC